MSLANSAKGYGLLSIALHWLGAAAVIAMLVIGLQADWAGEAGDRARRSELLGVHIALGASVALLILARIAAHYLQRQPEPTPQPRVLNLVSKAVHHLLLLALVLLFISGPMAVWSGARDISVFGAFAIPSPFAERNEGVHEIAEQIHAVGRYMLYVLIPLHVLGALKHLVIDRDGAFQRMLIPTRGS